MLTNGTNGADPMASCEASNLPPFANQVCGLKEGFPLETSLEATSWAELRQAAANGATTLRIANGASIDVPFEEGLELIGGVEGGFQRIL
jgi:hypothetical protein